MRFRRDDLGRGLERVKVDEEVFLIGVVGLREGVVELVLPAAGDLRDDERGGHFFGFGIHGCVGRCAVDAADHEVLGSSEPAFFDVVQYCAQ